MTISLVILHFLYHRTCMVHFLALSSQVYSLFFRAKILFHEQRSEYLHDLDHFPSQVASELAIITSIYMHMIYLP